MFPQPSTAPVCQHHCIVAGHGFARASTWLAGVLMLLLIVPQTPVLASDLESVRLWRAPDHTRLVVDLSGRADYSLFTLDNPSRVVIDIKDTRLRAELAKVDLKNSPISKIRGGVRKGDDFRLVLDLATEVKPKAFFLPANQQYGHRLVVDLYDKQRSKTVVKTVPKNDGKRDIIIALDAGHGGEDPGAIGPKGIREKKVVLAIAREMKELFDRTPGYKATLVRDGDYYIGLSKRRDIARQRQADLFISIHADAFKDKRVSGSSVYTLSQSGASSASAKFLAEKENSADLIGGVDLSDKDAVLASVLLDLSMTATLDASVRVGGEILQDMKRVSKLHKDNVEHAGFAVLKSPDIPSVLVESGFISNPKEARRLASGTYQRQMAKAVYQGTVDYFDKNPPAGTLVYWEKMNPDKARQYRIASGDTLSEIAQRFSVSVVALRQYNGLSNDRIRVGQVLKIPPSSPSGA